MGGVEPAKENFKTMKKVVDKWGGFKSLLGRHYAPSLRGIKFAAVAQ